MGFTGRLRWDGRTRTRGRLSGGPVGEEFAHYEGVWLPLLRTEADLGQISNRATVIPGTETPYQGEPVPLPRLKTDHRPLLESRALRNALVQKVWIEDDVLYQYGRLRPLLDRVVGALEREVKE